MTAPPSNITSLVSTCGPLARMEESIVSLHTIFRLSKRLFATLIHWADPSRAMLKIRRLTIADYDRIVLIWRKAGLQYRPKGRDSKKEMVKQLQRFPDLFIGAFDGSELVGLCVGTDEGRKGWINRLAVHPKHRRRDIGTMLVQEMERIFRKRGLKVISALIEDRNRDSLAFFKKRGYKIHKDIIYVSKRKNEGV